MRYASILSLLIVLLLLAGCAAKEITTAGEKTTTTTRTTTSPTKATATETTTTKTTTVAPSTDVETADVPARIAATETGEKMTFQKVQDVTRTKAGTEKCSMPFPLDCPKYLAKDGIVYITIKNAGYTSKIKDVVLTLDGDDCDPVNSYIETGQIKEFECYVSTQSGNYVTGNIEMNYYSTIDQKSFMKTGTINVMME